MPFHEIVGGLGTPAGGRLDYDGEGRSPVKQVVFAHRKLSYGGGERVLIEQVAALAELPVEITILFRKEPDRRDIEAELRARHPRIRAVLHLPGPLGCLRWLRRNPADLLVLCNHKGVQRALPWLRRFGGRVPPTVVTLHEHYPRHLAKYRGIRGLVERWIVTWGFEAAVRAHLGPQPCALIHPLYPRPDVQPVTAEQRRAARAALGLPTSGPVVGYVGQIDARKDPQAFLTFATALAGHFGEDLRFLLAGRESAAAAALLDQAGRGALAGRLLRLGRVETVGPALAALDLYVMTSRNEGFFPLALIEALELGVPVLAPPVGGIGTVLREGEGGFLFEKADDRRPIPPAALEAAAARLAPQLADAAGWDAQRAKAHHLGTGLTRGYDAAQLFREALTPWLS